MTSKMPEVGKRYKCSDQNCDWLEFVKFELSEDKQRAYCTFQRHFKEFENSKHGSGAAYVNYNLEYFWERFEELPTQEQNKDFEAQGPMSESNKQTAPDINVATKKQVEAEKKSELPDCICPDRDKKSKCGCVRCHQHKVNKEYEEMKRTEEEKYLQYNPRTGKISEPEDEPKSIWKDADEIPESGTHIIFKDDLGNIKICFIAGKGNYRSYADIRSGQILDWPNCKYCLLTDFINSFEQLQDKVESLENLLILCNQTIAALGKIVNETEKKKEVDLEKLKEARDCLEEWDLGYNGSKKMDMPKAIELIIEVLEGKCL